MPSRDPDELERDVTDCTACGGDHELMVFRRLVRPRGVGDAYRWWGSCPENGDPMFLALDVSDGEVV